MSVLTGFVLVHTIFLLCFMVCTIVQSERRIKTRFSDLKAHLQEAKVTASADADVDDDADDDKEDESDESFLGFPSGEIAQYAVSQLGKPKMNVPCPFCKAKTPKWDVIACANVPVRQAELMLMVLCCPTCASVRMVNPHILGVSEVGEDGEMVWKTGEKVDSEAADSEAPDSEA